MVLARRVSYFDGWPTLGVGFLTKNLLGPVGDWLGAAGCSFLSLGMSSSLFEPSCCMNQDVVAVVAANPGPWLAVLLGRFRQGGVFVFIHGWFTG